MNHFDRIPGRACDIGVITGIVLLALLMAYLAPVNAAPVAKQQEAGCTPVGKVGNWSVSHCFDGYGHEFIANDAGFIAPLGN